MFPYRGSTAMITGASKGLGAAFAKELGSRGMNLVLVARSIDALQGLADSLGTQYGVRCVALPADLAAPDAVRRIVTELERLDLTIDMLVNNEGVVLRHVSEQVENWRGAQHTGESAGLEGHCVELAGTPFIREPAEKI